MMPHDTKKGMITILMGSAKKTPKVEEKEEEKEYGIEEAYEDAAKEIIMAVEMKDSEMLAEALKAFIDMCKHDEKGEM